MPKTHTFDDGVTVELDDDINVEDFHDADAEEDITGDDYAALVAQAEADETEAGPLDVDSDEEPDGIGEGK